MEFDPLSYGLGFASAAGVSLVAWRYRRRLARLQESAESQVEGTREFIGRAADARYYRDVLRMVQAYHVFRDRIPLSEIVMEPRLIAPPVSLAVPGGEDAVAESVFDVVPVIHDLPQSYSPYNIETIPLRDLGAGHRQVALLGASGSGKSTTLATLALMALGEIAFETMEDLTAQAIDEQEQNLSQDERDARAREREHVQERALEKLREVRERQEKLLSESTLEAQDELPPIDVDGLLPVLVHLHDIDIDPALYGKDSTVDPAEPLVRAVQHTVGSVTRQVVGSAIYPALETGTALVLIDGWDELSPAARDGYFHWLRSLCDVYRRNLMVIAGPVEGYDQLADIGFMPTFLRPWRDDDFTTFARRVSAIWTTQSKGKHKAAPPDEQTMKRMTVDNRGRSALDVTLKIWAALANDEREAGRYGWYDAYARRVSGEDALRALLPAIAEAQLDAGGPLDQAAIEAALAHASEEATAKGTPKASTAIERLTEAGLLRQHANQTYSLVHPQVAGFLASDRLVQRGSDAVTEKALEPAWEDAIGFAAAHINIMPAVYRKLSTTPDLLYNNLFRLVRWMPDAPVDAPWRGDIFKRLAAAMMTPEQFPTVRARAMAAMIASRDRNVLFILRQALRAADSDIRRLACVGLGALGSSEAIRDLQPMLGDEDRDVQLAAGLALGAIGTERALEIMVEGLLAGSEELRRAVAEALAAVPDEGHAILRDAIQAQDIMIRRATVYGLSRVRAPWALTALYQAMIEDEQWYVRTAAEEAFMKAQSPSASGVRPHPEADSLVWLIQWAADRGEGVPTGDGARQVLVRALQEGQPIYKIMAALTLGRLGHVPALKPLYAALRDRSPEVRDAAYLALADIEVRLGEPLPGLA